MWIQFNNKSSCHIELTVNIHKIAPMAEKVSHNSFNFKHHSRDGSLTGLHTFPNLEAELCCKACNSYQLLSEFKLLKSTKART